MRADKRSALIVMAEDDDDDHLLATKALRHAKVLNEPLRVRDGVQLMDYLHACGTAERPRPSIILLDLNMPRKDGRECLEEIKADPELRRIPVVVLTTSKSEEDIVRSYDLGVNSFIRKPLTFEQLVEAMRVFGRYWLDVVELPDEPRFGAGD